MPEMAARRGWRHYGSRTAFASLQTDRSFSATRSIIGCGSLFRFVGEEIASPRHPRFCVIYVISVITAGFGMQIAAMPCRPLPRGIPTMTQTAGR